MEEALDMGEAQGMEETLDMGEVQAMEEEEAPSLEVGDRALLAPAAPVVRGKDVGIAPEGTVVMEEGPVEPRHPAAEMGLRKAGQEEGGLLQDRVTGLPMEVAQVPLEMLLTSKTWMQNLTGGTGWSCSLILAGNGAFLLSPLVWTG